MSKTVKAVLADGSKIPYVRTDKPPHGGMKHTFFAPDRSYVVQFFNDPKVAEDKNLRERLELILGRYNPTRSETQGGAKGGSEQTAKYFSELYCWPQAIVEQPEFGIVCPTYPENFFFGENASIVPGLNTKGQDKKSNWFTSPKLRKYLAPAETGDFRTMLRAATNLARAIRRMHSAGLAHSDLSNNNVLIDPSRGACVVIDIDSLVVPGKLPPEVVGTRGYIAPEVLATSVYDRGDARRKLPSIETDLHSLAVLIYEYLLMRHPLMGRKVYSTESAEQDDFLGLGEMATFIENPNDTSNPPLEPLEVTIDALGPGLKKLFLRAFVDGLHDPAKRPAALEWEGELEKACDLLHPCPNPSCPSKWFVMTDVRNGSCPHCGTKIPEGDRLQLSLKRPASRAGQWRNDRIITLYNGQPIYGWHVFRNESPNERADWQQQAHIVEQNGRWFLVNDRINGLRSPAGSPVPKNHAVELKKGVQFLMSEREHGRLAEVIAP